MTTGTLLDCCVPLIPTDQDSRRLPKRCGRARRPRFSKHSIQLREVKPVWKLVPVTAVILGLSQPLQAFQETPGPNMGFPRRVSQRLTCAMAFP